MSTSAEVRSSERRRGGNIWKGPRKEFDAFIKVELERFVDLFEKTSRKDVISASTFSGTFHHFFESGDFARTRGESEKFLGFQEIYQGDKDDEEKAKILDMARLLLFKIIDKIERRKSFLHSKKRFTKDDLFEMGVRAYQLSSLESLSAENIQYLGKIMIQITMRNVK